VTTDETFLWYEATPRLSVGVAFLLKQGAFRALGSYTLSPETASLPSLHASFGIQEIATGNPGLSLTAERNFRAGRGNLNVYSGIGYRTNIRRANIVGGIKYSPSPLWTIGLQNDGIHTHPFLTYSWSHWTTGFYLINSKSPGILFGTHF
jgi:hypothetical protein